MLHAQGLPQALTEYLFEGLAGHATNDPAEELRVRRLVHEAVAMLTVWLLLHGLEKLE